MSTQLSLENFEEIYNDTYNDTLKYILCKCSNIDDVNDLLQETYIELYKILKRKDFIVLDNCQNYIIGIAKKRIQRYYGFIYKLKAFSIFGKKEDQEYELDLPSSFDIEMNIITKMDVEEVVKYIKQKDISVIQVFYLYYCSELKISQIATELNISESKVKHILYRTIKNIKDNIKIEGDMDV